MSETTNIIILIVTLLVGGLIGFAIYHLTLGKKEEWFKAKELEASKAELEQYKSQVNNHFKDSAELMGNVASSYQALHSHMATQSESLLSEDSVSPYPLLETAEQAAHEKALLEEQAEREAEAAKSATLDEQAAANEEPIKNDTESAAKGNENELDTDKLSEVSSTDAAAPVDSSDKALDDPITPPKDFATSNDASENTPSSSEVPVEAPVGAGATTPVGGEQSGEKPTQSTEKVKPQDQSKTPETAANKSKK